MDDEKRAQESIAAQQHQQFEQYQQTVRQYEQQQVMGYEYQQPPPDWSGMQQPIYHSAPYQYQYPMQQMGEVVPLPLAQGDMRGPAVPLEAMLGPFLCARIQNLPGEAGFEDVLVLFQGLMLIDIVQGEYGEAFVIFPNSVVFQLALQRDRQSVRGHFVEISGATRHQYYAAITKRYMKQMQEGGVSTSPLFGSFESQNVATKEHQETTGDLQGESLRSIIAPDAPAAPVIFPVNADMVPTAHHLNRSSPLEAQEEQQLSVSSGSAFSGRSKNSKQKRTGGGVQIGTHTGFLRMRGLPFTASKEDIVAFFDGYNPVQESIVVTYRSDGRPTGEAYIGFANPNDSERAIELHRKIMGSRYIELFISNKDEHERALNRFKSAPETGGGSSSCAELQVPSMIRRLPVSCVT